MNCRRCGRELHGHTVCPGCGATLPVAPRGPRLPDEPWELTAPESYLLRYEPTNSASSREAFKLALMDLIARDALTLRGAWVPRRWRRGARPWWLLCNGTRKAVLDEPALVPLIALHSDMVQKRPSFGVPFDDRTIEVRGVPLDKFVSAAARRNGGYAAYLKGHVASSLRNRGLLTVRNRRTPVGEEAWHELDAWLELARDPLKSWIHDPTWLRAYVTGAGAAVLLAEIDYPGHPTLQNIGRALASNPPVAEPSELGPAWWDTGGLDFDAIADGLDGACSAFDGVFSALDAAFLGGSADFGGGGDGG